MTSNEPSLPGVMHLLAQGDIVVLESLTLVLEAVGINYHLQELDTTLWVAEADLDQAMEQLNLYQQENLDWPPVESLSAPHPQVPPTVLVMGVLVLFFLFTGEWTAHNPWFNQGAVDAVAVRHGQWWRLLTGLTLHADSVHLLGNCCLGGLLVHLLSRSIGYGLAWALLIGCGVLGNWCNVVARESGHLSVGFSTSVFAAVGILSGMQVFRRRIPFVKDLVLPLGAGLALLALLGTEGEHTDLGAHFFGFFIGICGGLVLRCTPLVVSCRSATLQKWLFGGTVSLVLIAWWQTTR
ncbi:MAG: rhomboid family intramembrane serine protease [Desulfobulbus sp.]|nr:rhomboid family intramembrane serine protease [Desulfobulbus sp.]